MYNSAIHSSELFQSRYFGITIANNNAINQGVMLLQK